MKTRLLWALVLSVGTVALYFGIVQPEVSTTPKRIQDFVDQDPATRPAIQLPPLVVSEPRLPAGPAEPADSDPRSPKVPPADQTTMDQKTASKDTDPVTREASTNLKR